MKNPKYATELHSTYRLAIKIYFITIYDYDNVIYKYFYKISILPKRKLYKSDYNYIYMYEVATWRNLPFHKMHVDLCRLY